MKKRILTWIQPSDKQLHIGNYLGAIKPMIQLSEQETDAEFFMFLANMHAFTKLHDGTTLRENAINIVKLYLACGINPEKIHIYNPAEIPAHAQLNWVLGCLTIMGTMERMHSYKDAVAKWKAWEVSVGTFNYPILMAADILLYDANYVPVGKDQKQHVEYARDIALKFNREFWETFVIPEPKIDPNVATIIGSDGRKMSKSYNNYIGLLDDEKTVLKRVKQIPTSTQTVEESKNPDECNVYLLAKYFLTADEDGSLRKRYLAGGLSFKEAKEYLFEKIMNTVTPIQNKFNQISDEEVLSILKKGREIVAPIAEQKIQQVYEKVWFILR